MKLWKSAMLCVCLFTMSISGMLLAGGPSKSTGTAERVGIRKELTLASCLIEKESAEKEPAEKATSAKEPVRDGESKQKSETAEKKRVRPDNLQPLYRFYDHALNEHIYSLKKDQIEAWRKKKHFQEQVIIGDVSAVELPDTVRLWRAIRHDGKHFFYFRSNGQVPVAKVEDIDFRVWVWTQPGDGRIPIYGHTWIDETDVFLEVDLKNVSKFREDSLNALGVNRLSLAEAGDETPVFYVYPHVVAKKPEDAKPKSPEKNANK